MKMISQVQEWCPATRRGIRGMGEADKLVGMLYFVKMYTVNANIICILAFWGVTNIFREY